MAKRQASRKEKEAARGPIIFGVVLILVVIIGFAVLGYIASKNPSTTQTSTTEVVHMHGNVTEINDENILLEVEEGADVGLTTGEIVSIPRSAEGSLNADALNVGDAVEVWFDGEIMDVGGIHHIPTVMSLISEAALEETAENTDNVIQETQSEITIQPAPEAEEATGTSADTAESETTEEPIATAPVSEDVHKSKMFGTIREVSDDSITVEIDDDIDGGVVSGNKVIIPRSVFEESDDLSLTVDNQIRFEFDGLMNERDGKLYIDTIYSMADWDGTFTEDELAAKAAFEEQFANGAPTAEEYAALNGGEVLN